MLVALVHPTARQHSFVEDGPSGTHVPSHRDPPQVRQQQPAEWNARRLSPRAQPPAAPVSLLLLSHTCAVLSFSP